MFWDEKKFNGWYVRLLWQWPADKKEDYRFVAKQNLKEGEKWEGKTEVSTKGNTYKVMEASKITGKITDIKISEYEANVGNKKEIKKLVKIYMDDENDSFELSLTLTGRGREILLSLANLNRPKDVSISVYTKDKDNGTGFYTQSSVKQGGESVRWKYNVKDLNEKYVTSTEFDGKIIKSFRKLDEFFLESIVPEIAKIARDDIFEDSNEEEDITKTLDSLNVAEEIKNRNKNDDENFPF